MKQMKTPEEYKQDFLKRASAGYLLKMAVKVIVKIIK